MSQYYPTRYRIHHIELSPCEIVSIILNYLRSNMHKVECQELIRQHFNPVHMLGEFANNPENMIVDKYVGLTIAELMRRVIGLLQILKKIGNTNKELYLSETINTIMYPYWRTIIKCGCNDTYAYTIVHSLYNLNTRLLQTFEDLEP